jgi:hypothetical protein
LASCAVTNLNYETGVRIVLNYNDDQEPEDYNYYYLDNIEGKHIALNELIKKVWDDHAKPASLINDHLTYSTEVGRFSLCQGDKPLVPVIIELELDAKTVYHYGRLNLEDGKGFFDSQRDVLHLKEFKCSSILWKDASKDWPSTFDSSAIPFRPIFYIYLVTTNLFPL